MINLIRRSALVVCLLAVAVDQIAWGQAKALFR